MSKNRFIVHELSESELIKLATESDEEVVYDKISEAAKFIYALGIKHGTERISAQLLYYTYKEWKGWRAKKQPKGPFFRDFNKYFESQRSRDGRFYNLNPKPFDTSEEVFWIIRKELRDAKARKKAKKAQKSGQVPGSNS